MDSTQMWFCRDLWTDAARDGLKEGRRSGHHKFAGSHKRRHLEIMERQLEAETEPEVVLAPKAEPMGDLEKRQEAAEVGTEGAEIGTDADAIDEDSANPAPAPLTPQELPASAFLIPNHAFTPARILVNPRCVTTYGGISHTQLARDLFGDDSDHGASSAEGNYVLEDWAGPPDSFVCQEMRTTGGRTAAKTQRRVGFLLQNEVGGVGWGG